MSRIVGYSTCGLADRGTNESNGSDFAQIPNSLLLDYNSLLGIKFGNFNSPQDCVGNSAKIPSNISSLTVHFSS
jgi:hypothetical protein